MAELSELKPTRRFTGLSNDYARFRPHYPNAALDYVIERCGLHPGCQVVDVGAGTGIASRLFALRAVHVVGIEPNGDMRAQAIKEQLPPGVPAPDYRDGRAEATGLETAICDAVLCAQAFHWFEPERALAEFHRILKPRGWVILLGYERHESEPFTAEYGRLIRALPDAEAIEAPRRRAGDALFRSDQFERAEKATFVSSQELDEQALVGRSLSISYAPREPGARAAFEDSLRQLFAQGQRQGMVCLHYETSVYSARRRDRTAEG